MAAASTYIYMKQAVRSHYPGKNSCLEDPVPLKMIHPVSAFLLMVPFCNPINTVIAEWTNTYTCVLNGYTPQWKTIYHKYSSWTTHWVWASIFQCIPCYQMDHRTWVEHVHCNHSSPDVILRCHHHLKVCKTEIQINAYHWITIDTAFPINVPSGIIPCGKDPFNGALHLMGTSLRPVNQQFTQPIRCSYQDHHKEHNQGTICTCE